MKSLDKYSMYSEGEKQKKLDRSSSIDTEKYGGYTKSGNWERGENSQPSLKQSLRGMMSAEVVDLALESRERVSHDQDINPLWRDGTMASTERTVDLTSKYAPGFVGGLAGIPEMGQSFRNFLRQKEDKEFREYQRLASRVNSKKKRPSLTDEDKLKFSSLKGKKGYQQYNIYQRLNQVQEFNKENLINRVRKKYPECLELVQDWLKTVSFSSGEGSSSQQPEVPLRYEDLPMTDMTHTLLERGQKHIEELEKQLRESERKIREWHQ